MTFNILDDPWIEVFDHNGFCMVGAREALTRAHVLQPVTQAEDGSYAVLMRFLVSLWASSGAAPSTDTGWEEAWHADTLPIEMIEAYCDRWRNRFNLIDDTHPFRQCRDVADPSRGSDQLRLGAIMSRGGRAMGWDGEIGRSRWSLAEAVMPLLRGHEIDPAGIKAGLPGNRSGKTYGAVPGPIGTSTMVIPSGPTLKETLLMCLPPFTRADTDAPSWERDPQEAGIEVRTPTGVLDWLTWPARSIRLFAEGDQVSGVAWHDGHRIPDKFEPVGLDPMAAWRRYAVFKKGQPGHSRARFEFNDRSMLSALVLNLVPWIRDDLDLPNIVEIMMNRFATAPAWSNVLTHADTIGDTPIRLQFTTTHWGPQRSVLEFIDTAGWFTGQEGAPIGTGNLLTNPDKVAVLCLVAAWAPSSTLLVRDGLRSAESSVVRDLADKTPVPDIEPDEWRVLIAALETPNIDAWQHAAIEIIARIKAEHQDWINEKTLQLTHDRTPAVHSAGRRLGWSAEKWRDALKQIIRDVRNARRKK